MQVADDTNFSNYKIYEEGMNLESGSTYYFRVMSLYEDEEVYGPVSNITLPKGINNQLFFILFFIFCY